MPEPKKSPGIFRILQTHDIPGQREAVSRAQMLDRHLLGDLIAPYAAYEQDHEKQQTTHGDVHFVMRMGVNLPCKGRVIRRILDAVDGVSL